MKPGTFRQKYIKNNPQGHFFDRDTMDFFGDTMKSYKCIFWQNKDIMYRRPDVMVDVFGTWYAVSSNPKKFFSAWFINDNNKIQSLDTDEKMELYNHLRSLKD